MLCRGRVIDGRYGVCVANEMEGGGHDTVGY